MRERRTSIFFFLLVTFLAACKITGPEILPEVASVPVAFDSVGVQSDSSISSIPWNEFFKDQHLTQLIEDALEGNPDLLIALQRIEFARADKEVARGLLLPSVQLNIAGGQRKFGEYTMDGVGNFDTNFSNNIGEDKHIPVHLPDYYTGFQAAWEIDLWGKLRSQKKAAAARFMKTESGRHLVTTQLVAAVARTYYILLSLDNELKIIHENIELQQHALDIVEIQKIAGSATELAVKQFEAQLLNTKSLEGRIRQEIVRTENQMNLLLGRFPQAVERGLPILEQPMPLAISAGVPSGMVAKRPDIRQAEWELLAARADLSAARAAFYPSLTLSSAVGLQAFRTSVLFSNPGSLAYSIFGGLTQPIFNRFSLRSAKRRAEAYQIESLYQYHKTVLTAFQEVINNLRMIETMRSVSALKEQEVKVLQEGVAAANDLYLAGLASYLEVVTAQKSVLTSELELIETRNIQFQANIDLYRSVGGGW